MNSEASQIDRESKNEFNQEKTLQKEIENRVKAVLFPLLAKYGIDSEDLEAILKWKPIALILGNYSSGKSTLINELLGQEIQRTGQAPTDDSFTIITAPAPEESLGEIRGTTLVNNERLPFGSLKSYGEPLLAHFRLKYVNSPLLENLAIIDSPGMMDSVTEKGRGYDFLNVVGDLTKLADLVVLMFDPHKAGTIKETYSTIRNTLPGTSGEDRIAFVMSRIDDCDNLADLVRSYGTLCWNLSQMTGRKDIPRIFLTYSPMASRNTQALDVWVDERKELNQRILKTPELRIGHILHHVDKLANELKMVIEAMIQFCRGARRLLFRTVLITILLSIYAVFFLDLTMQNFTGFPKETFLSALVESTIAVHHLLIPALGLVSSVLLMTIVFTQLLLPYYSRRYQKNLDRLVDLSSPYREHIWSLARSRVFNLLGKITFRGIFGSHQKNLDMLERFMKQELQMYFEKIK
ncbi:MAG: dynamin family protein [Deltaproteobacteria bacterium]|nr:dynamin family protein [Deltaproteobacteria bacterium]MBW2154689.1 dynamin family protein [Deltaproteobacteria bacterium]